MDPTRGGDVSARRTPGPRTLVVALAALLIVAAPVAVAAVTSLHFGRTDVTVAADPITLLAYGGAPTDGWPTPDSFTVPDGADLVVSTDGLTAAPVGSAAIEGVTAPAEGGPTWWDEAFGLRICDDLLHADAGAQAVDGWVHRLSVDLDELEAAGLLRPDRGDLRAVVDGTETTFWIPSTPATGSTETVHVLVPELTAEATTSVCLYLADPDAAATANQGAALVYGPAAGRTVDLVALDADLDGTQSVSVAAAHDGTAVAVTPTATDPQGVTAALDAGEVATIGVEPGTIVRSDGPLSSRILAAGADSLAPTSWSTLEAVVPLSVDGQRLALAAPFGEATVTISRGATTLATVVVGDGSSRLASMPVTVWADTGAGDPAAPLAIAADRPVLVAHDTADGHSTVLAPPGADAWGVGPTTASALAPGGQEVPLTLTASDAVESAGLQAVVDTLLDVTGAATGIGGRLAVAPSAPAAARMTAWVTEAAEAAVLPSTSELSSRYVLPVDAEEILLACQVAAGDLALVEPSGAERTLACTGEGAVGVAAATAVPAGTIVSSDVDATFALSIRATGLGPPDGADLTSVLGPTQARPAAWPVPSAARRVEGLLPESITWTGAPIGTDAGAVGALSADVLLPVTAASVTDVVFTVSSGSERAEIVAAPDDADVAAPSAGDGVVPLRIDVPLPAALDGADSLVVSAELRTSDRTVAATVVRLEVSHDLPVAGETVPLVEGPILRVEAAAGLPAGSTLTVSGNTSDLRLFVADEVAPGPSVPFDPGATVAVSVGSPGALLLEVDLGGSGVRSIRPLEVVG